MSAPEIQISGEVENDFSGLSVSSAGDVNGDGFDEIIVGAFGADPNGGYSGASYVVFGRTPDTAVTRVGAAADQTIRGGAFGDILLGRGGDDSLAGAGGRDALDGGAGADTLFGGGGRDTAVYRRADAGVTVDLVDPSRNAGEAAGDTYLSIESFALSDLADSFLGAGADDAVQGGAGADKLRGRGGSDFMGGGDGADTLAGGAGLDRLSGGAGADRFVFTSVSDSPAASGRDRIADFQPGADLLDPPHHRRGRGRGREQRRRGLRVPGHVRLHGDGRRVALQAVRGQHDRARRRGRGWGGRPQRPAGRAAHADGGGLRAVAASRTETRGQGTGCNERCVSA